MIPKYKNQAALDKSFTELCEFLGNWQEMHSHEGVTLETLMETDEKFNRLSEEFSNWLHIAYVNTNYEDFAPLTRMNDQTSLLSDRYKSWAWENYSRLNGVSKCES